MARIAVRRRDIMFNRQLALALAAVATLGIAVTQSAGAMGSHLPKPVNTHPSSLGAMEFHQPKTEIAHPSSLARILARDRMPWGGGRDLGLHLGQLGARYAARTIRRALRPAGMDLHRADPVGARAGSRRAWSGSLSIASAQPCGPRKRHARLRRLQCRSRHLLSQHARARIDRRCA